jgi:4-hydroxy-tetrahydrodipicolinate synthase
VELAGLWVPLVTPMLDGGIDIRSLRRLCLHLLELGVDGLVPCGTTGEAPTLTESERAEVIACVADVAGGGVIAGAGATSTSETVHLTKMASMAGAAVALVISPPFVAPSQEEIEAHYHAVANGSPIPIMVYNFPARTGTEVAAATTLALAEHPSIIGTKQSVATVDRELQDVIVRSPADFCVFVGNALVLWPALAIGAAGGIIAAAHVETTAILRLVRFARGGDLRSAQDVYRELWPRLGPIDGPAAIKRHLAKNGVIASAEMRAPLRA